MTKNKQNTINYLRHGESTANEDGILAGQLDVPLTAKGIKQAEAVGDTFHERGVHFDTIITSTLERARHTAHIIRDRTASNRNLPSQLIVLPELVERNGGAFQGHSIDAFYAADDDALQAAGGESIRDFVDRAKRVNATVRRIAVGNTLVVGHAELYRAMQLASRDLPLDAFDTIDKPANAVALEFPSIPLNHPGKTPISHPGSETLPLEQMVREMTHLYGAPGRWLEKHAEQNHLGVSIGKKSMSLYFFNPDSDYGNTTVSTTLSRDDSIPFMYFHDGAPGVTDSRSAEVLADANYLLFSKNFSRTAKALGFSAFDLLPPVRYEHTPRG